MHDRHQNRKRYFLEQEKATREEVIPYLAQHINISEDMRVLEIGCGEAGNLKPFLDMGCDCVGVDISKARIENARKFYADHLAREKIKFISNDIYKVGAEDIGTFDFLMMRDVIEHIPGQEKFMNYVKRFMKPSGKFFLGFPPWYMPFGGHQQICKSKVLSMLPYFHILPKSIYKSILALGEDERRIEELLEIKDTGISIERFERIIGQENYRVINRTLYLINPNYRIKFHLKPRKQLPIVREIPFIRNFVTTCAYYILSK